MKIALLRIDDEVTAHLSKADAMASLRGIYLASIAINKLDSGDDDALLHTMSEYLNCVVSIAEHHLVGGESGMPAIIWSGENNSSDSWLQAVSQIQHYNVKITLATGKVIEGQIFRAGRTNGMPSIHVMCDNDPPGTGHAAEYDSESIDTIYVY